MAQALPQTTTSLNAPLVTNLPAATASNLEKLLKMDDDLQLLQQKRKELDRSIAHLESQLYNTEKRYLESTSMKNGNVSIGFSGYYPNSSQPHGSSAAVPTSTYSSMYANDDEDDVFEYDNERPKTISLSRTGHTNNQVPLFSSSSSGAGQESQQMVFSYSSNTLRKSLQSVNDEYESGTSGADRYHSASGSSGHHHHSSSKSSGARRKKSIVRLSLVSQ